MREYEDVVRTMREIGEVLRDEGGFGDEGRQRGSGDEVLSMRVGNVGYGDEEI